MVKYHVKIKLLSETVLASGEDLPGLVDIEIQHDELGFPYLKAKTLKGLLREQMELIEYAVQQDFSMTIKSMLGAPDSTLPILKFSDATISKNIKYCVGNSDIKPEEIFNVLTTERYFNEMTDGGITKDHSLRKVRVIKKGLVLNAELIAIDSLTAFQENLLSASIRAVRHIGTMRSKGKGLVECSLYKNEQELPIPGNAWYKEGLPSVWVC